VHEQSRIKIEKRKKPKRRKRNNKHFFKVYSNKSRRFRPLSQARSTTRLLFVPTSKLVSARRERDASTLTT